MNSAIMYGAIMNGAIMTSAIMNSAIMNGVGGQGALGTDSKIAWAGGLAAVWWWPGAHEPLVMNLTAHEHHHHTQHCYVAPSAIRACGLMVASPGSFALLHALRR